MQSQNNSDQQAKAYFAGGCFWCTEAIFQMIKGVSEVTNGYAGGSYESPSYEEVSKGQTGHAEAIQITYDPKVISFEELLYVFLNTHDPTTKDQQGADVGSQYRSVIFYSNNSEKKSAQKAVIEAQEKHQDRIVTEILPLKKFYQAEGYHQDYYKNNPNVSYCKVVIDPKIQKLKKDFGKYLDANNK
ncbi:peptide-methionine (S)-S-oxide reductase MsrA [Candidatus Woesebacteria bacterium]|nr:peptide-methionine (S)-S-oxide reductase MsrA [Candidatus Woesebacteria bacterium]